MCRASCPARTRVFATVQGRKTGATDAHSVALAATRMSGLRRVVDGQQLTVLQILADRRRSVGEDHTRKVSQLHQLLAGLIPDGAKKDLSAAQARALPTHRGANGLEVAAGRKCLSVMHPNVRSPVARFCLARARRVEQGRSRGRIPGDGPRPARC